MLSTECSGGRCGSVRPDVDVALFRDCDSRIGRREAESGRGVAAILGKDFPHHARIIPGMVRRCWAACGDAAQARCSPGIDELVAGHGRAFDHFGCDQRFPLAQRVYPVDRRAGARACRISGGPTGNPTMPFPSQREDYEFVGEKFDERERRHAVHRSKIRKVLRRQRLRSRLAGHCLGRGPRAGEPRSAPARIEQREPAMQETPARQVVWRDMDQKALDDAYDQDDLRAQPPADRHAPHRRQRTARARVIGPPQRIAYGPE